MNIVHAKSPCCQGRVIRFGTRRRQCVSCHTTWRIRKKKRGRKGKRPKLKLLFKYLDQEMLSLYAQARVHKRRSKDQLQRDVRRALLWFLDHRRWPKIPVHEPLIALADAMIINGNKRAHSFYFIFLRGLSSTKAVITKPYSKAGNESWCGWQEAFRQLSPRIKNPIVALVSDGHRGLVSVAKAHGWLLQRCNFHIIARMQGRRSRWRRSRHQIEGAQLYSLVNEILTQPREREIADALEKLKQLADTTNSPQLRRYLSGFRKHYREYRTYLEYPQYQLPRTSNSVETVIGHIRKLLHRAHGFRTITSLKRWVEALLKHRRIVTCNGYRPTKLSR